MAFVITALFGCSSGGGGGGGCANAAACGGDIVGTWTVTSTCVTATGSASVPNCPSATLNSVSIGLTGTITYNADLTYTGNSTTSLTETVTLPASCLTQQGVTATCAQLTQNLATNPDFKSANCTGSSGCTCTVAAKDSVMTDTGTYTTTAAGKLNETTNGSTTVDSSDYCVKGTTLTVSPSPGSAMMGDPTISGSITLTKQ
jgi:hypothetical protein